MGLFVRRPTRRQMKKQQRELRALRRVQEAQAQEAAVGRDMELFRQLPAEGKEAYREIDAEYRSLGPLSVRRRKELIRARDDLFRSYDLVP